MRLPTKNDITLPFGSTDEPYSVSNPHKGTDFSFRPDDTIYAVESGQAMLIPNNGNDGNAIYMRVENRFWGYLHCQKYLVENAQWVEKGQPIAIMGDTGRAFGRHLHLALKVNNVFVDPMSVIKEGGTMPLNPIDEFYKQVGLAVSRSKAWPAINNSADQKVVIQNTLDVINSLEDIKALYLANPNEAAKKLVQIKKIIEG